MAVAYFGNTTPGGSYYGDGFIRWNSGTTFTCPGSGTQNLVSLGLYCKSGGGTAGYMRLAIYTNAGALIAQGSARILINSTTAGWVEHTAFVDGGGSAISPTLTGGTAYIIAFSCAGSDPKFAYASGSAGAFKIAYSDYTNDMPDNLPAGDGTAANPSVRGGVEAAAGTSILRPIFNLSERRRRM